MFPDELVGDRWIRRRRGYRKGIGDDRWLENTPIQKWKLCGGDWAGRVIISEVSARKLAAFMWRLCADDGGRVRRRCGYPLFGGFDFALCSWLSTTKCEIEGITKWDLCNSKTSIDVNPPRCREIATIASARQPALHKAQKHVNELGAKGVLREKLKSCIKKLDKERASGIKPDHNQGMRSIVKNLAVDIKREREKCKKLDIVNSKLLSDITKTKWSTRKLVQSLERERKARKLLEHAHDELAKVIKGNKAEIVELRNQCTRVQRDAEEGRKMMELREVWLEEQAQMMLLDAKFLLEDKNDKMNDLIADAEAFLRQSSTSKNVMTKAKDLNHAFDPQVNGSPRKSILANGINAGDSSDYSDASGKQIAAGCNRNTSGNISSVSLKQSKKKDSSINNPWRLLPTSNVHKHITLSSTTPFSCPQTALHEEAGDNNQASVHHQRNPHVDQAIKGHIMWPRGVRRHGAGAKNLQARMESQRMLIRNVLK